MRRYKETEEMNKKNRVNKLLIISAFIILLISVLVGFSSFASSQEVSVCCEKTKNGAFCQDTRAENCDAAFRKTPTSCDATSFCKTGCCYDSKEGTCMENTPQRVCESENGTWTDSAKCQIPQCQLGCCVLGSESSFVTLVRCKKLSAFYGLETDFRKEINSEIDCIEIAHSQEKGACVYEVDFIKTCSLTTKQECKGGVGNITSSGNSSVSFYKDLLCTAEELGTNCGPTTETTCIEGKDEVYFVDSCGNPTNIYDASKIKDKEYWTKMKSKEESCGYSQSNANSAGCGNCDYFSGSMCKDYQKGEKRPTYGDYICKDLNCKTTNNKESYRHGETWCVYDSKTGQGEDTVGSRHFRHLCIQNEEIIEPCADFRQEQCIQDSIETPKGAFQQSACRVNRWQDCIAQTKKKDCENTDKRDCFWKEGEFAGLMLKETENTSRTITEGVCLPNVPPGLKFWGDSGTLTSTNATTAAVTTATTASAAGLDQEAVGICAAANAKCSVQFEKGLLGKEECKENCECLTEEWAEKMNQVCVSLGDCGAYVNFIGRLTDDGYQWKIDGTEKKLKSVSAGIAELVR